MTTRGKLPDNGEGLWATAIDYLIDALYEELGMAPREFLRAWDNGELDPENPIVAPFVPSIPFLREWEKHMFGGNGGQADA